MSVFDPLEYPYLLNIWTMGPSIADEGNFNPRVNPKKKNNVLTISFEINDHQIFTGAIQR